MVEFHFQGTPRIRGVNEIEFNGSRNTTCWVREGDRPTLHVGLGPMAEEMADRFRQSCGVAAKALLRLGQSEFCLNLQGFETHAQAAAEGVLLAAYRFEDFKEPSARRKNPLRGLHAWVGARAMEAAKNAFARGGVLAEATNYARAVGNLPPNVIYPETLAEKARELAKEVGVECRVWDERALRREGFGGILAVGGGSVRAPRLIELKSRAAARKAPVVVVVGKAVTFDTGGVSIKPAERMEEMKWDKMGGCAVLGIVRAVKRLKLPIHLVGLIPSAENMPGASAYRPSDLVRTWDGKVIEVLNTDAEGRVILADALAYGRQTHKPDLMIDLATLTGACVVALGNRRAGLFTSDVNLRTQWMESGEATGDRVWPMPLGEEYDEQIRSDAGLVKNTGGREGGACTAASFLKHWAGEERWTHLDIAGPAASTRDLPHLEKGATGFGVRLVVDLLTRLYCVR